MVIPDTISIIQADRDNIEDLACDIIRVMEERKRDAATKPFWPSAKRVVEQSYDAKFIEPMRKLMELFQEQCEADIAEEWDRLNGK